MSYHPGEVAVQERAGKRQQAARLEDMVEATLSEPMAVFLARQPLVVIAAATPDGALWASPLVAPPGFVRGDATRVTLDLAALPSDDPLYPALAPDAPIGLLAIELATRRRIRVNGTVSARDSHLTIAIREAYANCPKYIQRRTPRPTRVRARAPTSAGTSLTRSHHALVAHADTTFVASHHPDAGADASHRGGEPGFVRLLDERTLRVPDYAGNNMFNTLGNLALRPEAGLTLVDFEDQRVLQLTGTATLHFDLPDDPRQPSGTGRYWDFVVDRFVERALPATLAWDLVDRSPFNPIRRT